MSGGLEESRGRIFLCGMMGVGKTTLGRALAEKLKCPFFDLDQLMDLEVGSHQEYLISHGEQTFRELEYQILLKSATPLERGIFSLGGGTLLHPSSFELVRRLGRLIYLKASLPALVARLQNDTKLRPLLLGGAEGVLQVKFQERERQYLTADEVVDTEGLSVSRLVDSLGHF